MKNLGVGDASGFDVIAGPGIDQTKHVDKLKGGKSKDVQLKAEYPVVGGSISVTADPANAVPESDEDNNAASVSWAALGVPKKSVDPLCPIILLCVPTPIIKPAK